MIIHVNESFKNKSLPIYYPLAPLQELINQNKVTQIVQRFYFKSKQDVQEYSEAGLWYQLYLQLSLRGFKEWVSHESEYELDENGVLTISRYFSIDRLSDYDPDFDTRFRRFLNLQSALLSLTAKFDHLVSLPRPE